jgi:hypothetical protein
MERKMHSAGRLFEEQLNMRYILILAAFLTSQHAFAMGSMPREGSGAVGEVPTVFIAAPALKVQQIIITRAASKGSVIRPAGNGQLILERQLPSVSPQVEAACGSGWAGRKVRVVISLQSHNGGTLVTERRFIAANGATGSDCAMPLTTEDYTQSMNALNEVKAQAETGARQ